MVLTWDQFQVCKISIWKMRLQKYTCKMTSTSLGDQWVNPSVPQTQSDDPQELVFTIPIFEPLPSQYYVRAISDRWLGSESVCAISFQHLILPEKHPPHTGTTVKPLV